MRLKLSMAALLASAVSVAAQVPTTRDTVRRLSTDTAQRLTTTTETARRTGVIMLSRDTVIKPVADQARGVDAEIRVALYELLADRAVPALRRLQWLAMSPVVLSNEASASGALRGRRDLMFLLAQAQYRFGMDSAFEGTAQPLITAGSLPPRYASLLKSQVLLSAYRMGDYARVVQLANASDDAATRGLASLVSGLASYQLRRYNDAHASFARAQSAAGPYTQYARYMDVVTTIRADTAQAASALSQLETIASASTGDFADQVRLTAAQLAYERGAYPQAVSLADAVSNNGALAAPALLTKAWAQYKADRIADAGQSFASFADRFPQLPERDEARLMAGQSLLQEGKTADAGRVFAMVADSTTSEVRLLQASAQRAMSDAAHALVAARAAGLLFVQDPATGKTVVLEDRAGADPALLAMAVSDTITAQPNISAGRLLSLTDVRARFDSVNGLGSAFPKRVLFSPASATQGRVAFAGAAQQLYNADAAIAIARYDLENALRAHEMEIALLKQLQMVLAQRRDSLAAVESHLQQNRAAMDSLFASLEVARARIKNMLSQQAMLLRAATYDNSRMIDSIKTALGSISSSDDQGILALETETLNAYRRTADMLLPRLDSAVAHHPAFLLADTVRARRDSVSSLLSQTRVALASAEQLVNGELTRLQMEPESITRLRGAVASAEARRSAAEARLVATVDAELRARSSELLADLQRNTEAAEFGRASASFFQALDQNGRANGAVGTTGAAGTANTTKTSVASSTTSPSPKQK
jgi:hypothetical protein